MKIENLITKCYDKQQRLFIRSFVFLVRVYSRLIVVVCFL